MPARIKPLAGTAAALVLVAGLLLMPLPHHGEDAWQSKLFDLGHVALFCALTLWLWWLLDRSWAAAIGIALALGGFTELVQDYFGRNGSLLDFVRDGIGSAIAVVLVHAWQKPRTFLRLGGHALAIAGLMAWPIVDSVPRLVDAYQAYQDFPILTDFATPEQMLRWHSSQAELERVPDPAQPSGWSGRLTLLPGVKRYPTAYLQPVVHDWSGYRRLCCSFTIADAPLRVVFSLRGRDTDGKSTHFQDPKEKTYAVGSHTLRLDLNTIARKARPTPLDLSEIRHFQVFIYRPTQARTICLHRIWLE